ncbi:peptidoglycan DD-metalloendopeptidase family protein [Bacillus cytotoxicus]|uniref:M23 family metallopeptidase n=1 Tax=Bacillus cytotoxicus TaxID=580165 RepID=UPI000660D954|nr:M23 family metallopeptidase [Bacillus cytotoxicus]AWC34032.1 M23 family peptidase [Bacillus cytotoxicus]AWC38032.1 M23 family peptidase [Bacillus cytotoxicus]AWC62245.1 M23 family peptidase [Bacillus cytotoxicus]KMT48925.1 peptidase M23 [Bacillus cytotoxicus]HDR7309741.1 M23 family metallopeptidase [Bacillus cytotoxicus]
MKNRRIEEIRKRIAKRKEEQERLEEEQYFSGEDFNGETLLIEEGEKEFHPLFRKDIFLFKVLLAAILVLSVAILFKNAPPSFDGARVVVTKVMKEEFQFAAVSKWYEVHFGKPLAFLPASEKKQNTQQKNYAVPASGKVTEGFQKNGQGVLVQTVTGATVESVNEGVVIFAGKKEGLGNTIEIQHADGTESWYGNLGEMSVKLYDYVEKKQKIGTVSNDVKNKNGKFYFAIKKNEKFIDPIQVISFD